jgi:hypothetical protein
MKKIFVVTLFLMFHSTIYGNNLSEADYRDHYCDLANGQTEVYLQDRDGGVYCDCLTEHYAVEVEFANKWAEAIGQSLYYAYLSDKSPMILLIMRSEDDMRYWRRLICVYFDLGIRIELIFPSDIQ